MSRTHPAHRLGTVQRRSLYVTAIALGASGVAWLLLHYFAATRLEDLRLPHPAEAWTLRLHGAAAMAALIVYGSLLPVHVRAGLSQSRQRRSGWFLLAGTGVLVLSAYALYYAGSDAMRETASWLHWTVGLTLVVAFVLHRPWRRRSPPAVR